MGSLLGGMFLGLLKTLLTKRFLAKIMVELFWYFSQQTENEVDDRGVKYIAEEWGVDLPKD